MLYTHTHTYVHTQVSATHGSRHDVHPGGDSGEVGPSLALWPFHSQRPPQVALLHRLRAYRLTRDSTTALPSNANLKVLQKNTVEPHLSELDGTDPSLDNVKCLDM